MKRKIPFLDLWLVSDRRLHAGYRYRYEKGYREGLRAGSADGEREAKTQGVNDRRRERRQVA